MNELLYDGIYYTFEYSQDTGYIEVRDNKGIIASGQMDDTFETFIYEYESTTDLDFEASGSSPDMYFNHQDNGVFIAGWLVATHPEYQ